jgi:peptide/nickel transport system substrate-binding protein
MIKEDVERAKKLLDEAGWKPGADGIREKDGVKLAPRVLFTQVGLFPRVSEAIQGYMRKIGVDWKIVGFDSTIAPAEMAKQDYELWTGDLPLHVGRRPAELLLRLAQQAGAQPHELERPADRRAAAQGQGGAVRRRPRQVLRPRPGAGDVGAPLDAGHERRHVRHQQQEAEGRAAHMLYQNTFYKGLDYSF